MGISWERTEELLGTTLSTTTTKMEVVVLCDQCSKEAIRVLSSVKQGMKRNEGQYYCHDCSTKNKDFRIACSKRAKMKWQDPNYVNNNLSAVRSEEYRDYKRKTAKEMWQDENFRAFMMSPEMRTMRQANSSKAAKEKWQDAEYRAKLINKLRQRMIRQWHNEDYRNHMNETMSHTTKQMWQNGVFDDSFGEEFSNKMTTINREILDRPEVLAKLSEASKQNWLNDDYRNTIILANQNKWKDPDHRRKMAEIRAEQPRISNLQTMLYDLLRNLKVDFQEEGHETTIGYYTFDCIIPKSGGMHKNLLIECQGDYWHSLEKVEIRDKAKFTYIEKYFPEHEIMYLWEHEFYTDGRVLDRLKLKLGLQIESIDFEFEELVISDDLESSEVSEFLDTYHYIGKGRSGITIGAKHQGKLVAVAVFSSPLRQNHAGKHGSFRELSRLCFHPSYHKDNLGSWFLSKCIKRISDVPRIIAYADTTVGHTGAVYKASNFKFSHDVKPDYWYVDKDGYVMHKRTLYGRASKMSMTEKDFALKFNYFKKYGGPKKCYVYDV